LTELSSATRLLSDLILLLDEDGDIVRSEVRKLRAEARRRQMFVIAAGALLVGVIILSIDAVVG